MVMGYFSKWVETAALPTNDSRVIVNFLKKNIFIIFGVPRDIISHRGIHFQNHHFKALLAKYGVKYKVALAYHPQTNGEVKASNKELEKNI